MYLSHYNFSEQPFQITADPKFIWLGEKHAEALATLQHGLQENKGFLLLTGDVGTGKTAVINTLLEKIDEKVIAVMLPDPGLDPIDLYNILSSEFKMNRKFSNKGDFLNHLKPFLYETYLQSKTILLVIDEAQNISHELLEEIRLLSNIESADAKLINIFIVGQNECNAILNENRNRAFKQGIGIRYHLDPLNGSETHEYINHRLKVAGSDKEIFSAKAIQDIHLFSAGFPRLINAICDLALLTGYSSGKDGIDEKIIKECAQGLKLPGASKIIEKEKLGSAEGRRPAPAGRKTHPDWRKFNLAASIVGAILITVFVFYNLYPNHSQFPTISQEAFRNYKRYEEKIEYVKKELRFADEEPVVELSGQKKIDKNVKKNIAGNNELPQSHILYFQNSSKELSKNNLNTLNRLAVSIRHYQNSEIIIEAHTDSHGNYWHNKKLSRVRANLVKNYFVNHGIIASRIKTIGLGAEYTIEGNDTEIGGKKNHRVEVKIISPQQNFILSQSSENHKSQ
jgi:general secretion pathway protein A